MASPSPFDVSELFRVDGMVAVITGGGTGIGLMMAKALVANGAAKVYIVGRRKEKLEATAKDDVSNVERRGWRVLLSCFPSLRRRRVDSTTLTRER